jgi:hypothetical protein
MTAMETVFEKLILQEIKMYDDYSASLDELTTRLELGYYPDASIKSYEELVDIKRQQWLGARKLTKSIMSSDEYHAAEKIVLKKKGAGILP